MSGSRRAAIVAAGVVIVLVVGALVWRAVDGNDDARTSRTGVRITEVGPAQAPFAGLTAATIRVGDRSLQVVVADDDSERTAGLRGRRDAAPYDGMLFVFGRDTTTAFTMAGVPGPLDIAFYAADGRVVDRLRMEPCAGSDATCPVYESAGAFRYALETGPGGLPAGRLR